jgi:hypothetical protein
MMQKMRTLTSREKKILFVTAAFIAVSLLYNLFLGPVLATDARLDAELKVLRTKLQKHQVLLAQKDLLRGKYPQFFTGVWATGKAAQESTSVLAELEALAKGAHLAVMDVRLGSAGETHKGRGLAVELKTLGTVEEHVQFLYDFENSLSLLKITGYALTAKPHTPAVEGRFSIATMDVSRLPAVPRGNERAADNAEEGR